jgi:adenine-specific DNA-methyltransferase
LNKVTSSTPSQDETPSAGLSQAIDQLKALFPSVVADGKIDFDRLRVLLGDEAVSRSEDFGLHWPGRAEARTQAKSLCRGQLLPCPQESLCWETSQNLVIEGDNLDVSKALASNYAGRIGLIYIDPPYNTGSDFVYHDRFQSSASSSKSANLHADWLNMMLPRLICARDLLAQDGVMVIHIDEHEVHMLALLLDEIFGEENVLGTIIWDKRNPKGDARGIAVQHESILVVARDAGAFHQQRKLRRIKPNAQRMCEAAKAAMAAHPSVEAAERAFREWLREQEDLSAGERAYHRIASDGRVYRLVSMAWPNKKRAPDSYFLPLVHPMTGLACPVPKRGWRNPPETMHKLLEKGLIEFGADHRVQPQRRYYLDENLEEAIPSIVPFGGSDDPVFRRWALPFEHPKPVALATQIVSWFARADDIVLDLFAGSATFAHATILANLADGGHRPFIAVQVPQTTAHPNFATIAEISKKRLHLVGAELRELAAKSAVDIGFRVYKWEPQV